MRIGKSKVFTLFALALLIVTLVASCLNIPPTAVGISIPPQNLHGPSLEPVHMHGPPLTPIHMNSNKTLTPVHMHFLGGVLPPLEPPINTLWHELYPKYCNDWNLTSWVDMQPPETPGWMELSPNDQIDMTNFATEEIRWYHVDRMTWTMLLYNGTLEKKMYVEYKGPYEKIYDPTCTLWHEVWPLYSNVYHVINWKDNGNGYIDFCDYVQLASIPGIWWHVVQYATDIILREKIMDPKCTWWHEIYPNYCNWYHLTSWMDHGLPVNQLSPSDQIDMTDESGIVTWYHVDRVTIAINVTLATGEWMKLELKTQRFDDMYEAFKNPVGTAWHEVYPTYSNVYALTLWNATEPAYDNCNGVFDPCDFIVLTNITGGVIGREFYCHVDDMCYDIILNKKIMDPRCTEWIEVHPEYDPPELVKRFHLNSWEDTNDDFKLSPCDQIDMIDIKTEEMSWWHVDRVTLTINITTEMGPRYLFEYKGPFEDIYRIKTDPISTLWHSVWPEYSIVVHLTNWTDNCNGVLDRCDYIWLDSVWCHVEGVFIDIILNKKIMNPVCTRWLELSPYFGWWYHLEGWKDGQLVGEPGYGMLSPCDNVNLTLQPMGPTFELHVKQVTLTINITYGGDVVLYEYVGPFENIYRVKTNPICTDWIQAWPFPGYPAHIDNWEDNCNGVLDRCDYVQIEGVWFHVEGVAIDMVVEPIPVHDVAVVSVSSRLPWVYQGQIDPIDVVIKNEGDFIETVAVYAFYDGTQAAPLQTTALAIGETKTLTFSWDTTGVPIGFYTVSANATIPIDDDPGDNKATGNVQEVREKPPPSPLPKVADVEFHPRIVVDLEDPRGTQWHELHPNITNYYKITSWKPGKVLGPEDVVLMWPLMPPPMPVGFVVDELTIDMKVLDLNTGAEYWLDYECGYWTFDPREPKCTKWHEIKNHRGEPAPMPRCWHLTSWIDESGDGKLSRCDIIDMTAMYPYNYMSWFHVENVTVTLKLTELEATEPVQYYLEFMGTLDEFQAMGYIRRPAGTLWLEILPIQERQWLLMDWMDQRFLSPSDLVVLNLKDPVTHEPIPGMEAEYHVDKLTVAMNVTGEMSGMHIVKFEGSLLQFKKYHWEHPWGTQWHEVNPEYCRQWYILDWYDSQPNYILDYCDWIYMIDKNTGWTEWFHVESLSTDMWLTMAVCDVEITSVVPETRYAYPRWTNDVDVTVHNNGTVTFNCTVTLSYYNGSAWIPIGTQSVNYLDPCNTVTLRFAWSLAGVPYCNRTLKADAHSTCEDTDTAYSWVKVKMPGDVDNDNDCDADDVFTYVSPSYGKKLGQAGFNKQCDFDDDNDCDADDVFTYLSPNYGKKATCK